MLFQILHGDASRISTDITPFHKGWCYVTHNGYMYVDMNLGTEDEPNNQRIKLNANDAQTLTGASLATILNYSEVEIPTSKAVLDALNLKANASDISDVKMLLGRYDTHLSWNEDETVYTETWMYDNNNYRQVLTEVSDTQFTKELFMNDISIGVWTITVDETNHVVNTIYVEE